jgi:hypothetical protein
MGIVGASTVHPFVKKHLYDIPSFLGNAGLCSEERIRLSPVEDIKGAILDLW